MTEVDDMTKDYGYSSTRIFLELAKEKNLLLDTKGQLSCEGEIIAKITESESSILIEFDL